MIKVKRIKGGTDNCYLVKDGRPTKTKKKTEKIPGNKLTYINASRLI